MRARVRVRVRVRARFRGRGRGRGRVSAALLWDACGEQPSPSRQSGSPSPKMVSMTASAW